MKAAFCRQTRPFCLRSHCSSTMDIFFSLGARMRLSLLVFTTSQAFTKNRLHATCYSALTVLGELDELSSSSGESSSSSGSVGMAGSSEGRERVWEKMKDLPAAQGVSRDSLMLWSLCLRGDPRSKWSSSSLSWKREAHMKTQTYVCHTLDD